MRRSALALAVAMVLLAACDSTTPSFPLPVLAGDVAFVTPVPGAIRTQGFGCTSFEREPVQPECPGGHFHAGVDLGAPQATPVLAAAGGLVTAVRWDPYGYGNYLVLDLGHGFTTLYAHLLETDVQVGEPVFRAHQVGLLGSSGNSTGAHLHFEVRSGGRPVDPELFLPAASTRGGSP